MREQRIVLPGLREAIASMEELISGCVETVSTEDPGLFGPGSVSWRIFREPAYGVSAIAALLLQALHPVAMAAIDQHSDYCRDAWRRAHRTTDYVFTIAFSGTATAIRAAERVRAIHRRINGTDPVTGRAYRADDPDLLLWIHCVSTEMALRGQETFGRPIPPKEADQFALEQVRAATLVGLEAAAVPRNRAAIRSYIDGVDIRLTPAAREFAALLFGARMPVTMRGFWALHVAGAVSLLPDKARALYAFPRWVPTGRVARFAIRAALRLMDRAYGAFPPVRRARRHLARVSRDWIKGREA
jgi:uncharacterized protein (DUF2236 family)